MPSIRVLPTHLVNKIAAGEVIERPASVVKELLENAVDAGASRIDVVVEDGGKKLISVTDDAAGMSAADLALAFRPHATSKILAEDDLYAIDTMGFRGEALATLASISHAHLRTRPDVIRDDGTGGEGGCEVSASGDTVDEPRPCAAAPGTTVTIRDLFFNTPARRKFMRTANTELGHITEQIARLSLPHPEVAFTLTHNGRKTQNLPAVDSTAARARDLFGAELADALLPIRQRSGAVRVAGLIAPPAAARGSGKWQYFFLNGRYVRDRLLGHALRESFRGLVDHNRWPVAFVFVEVDPADVDVNVHPTKIEVRFREGNQVHGQVLAALRETLNSADLTPAASLDSAVAESLDPSADENAPDQQRRQSLREALADFFKSVPPTQPQFSYGDSPGRAPHAPADRTEHDRSPPLAPAPTAHAQAPAAPADTTYQPAAPRAQPPAERRQLAPATTLQVHDTYIITADADGLIIIDQHALHERILYDELKRRLTDGPLTSQRMLIPETITVTAGESDALLSRSELLGRLGIEVVAFGPDTVAVQQFPALLVGRRVGVGEFVRELIDKLADDAETDPERLLEDLLEMMACKAAVKAGDPLSADEIDKLLAARQAVEKASSCPHGRPTTLRLTLKDLERQFKRT